MKTIKLSTLINASREKVWTSLWNDATYREWTAAFHEGSHAISDWKQGSEVLFLGPDECGMYSSIETLIENDTMIFQHHGEVKDGVRQPLSVWNGSRERYFLSTEGNETLIQVEMDSDEAFEEYFSKTFPLALAKVKEISERA
jgi:uncharacterized protein YndB with AHSA1/START domain